MPCIRWGAEGFLSTPSARRATERTIEIKDFQLISIHALREEGDCTPSLKMDPHTRFLSTPSARRATTTTAWTPRARPYFYPRPPRGGRPNNLRYLDGITVFLSTPSARRATSNDWLWDDFSFISIHALREEGDVRFFAFCCHPLISIHALREEGDSSTFCSTRWPSRISIHALREEGDRPNCRKPTPSIYFYPRPPRGGRRRDLSRLA